MSYASTCPAAIAGILAALNRNADIAAAVTAGTLIVTDGQGLTDPDIDQVISVGYSEGDESAADATITPEGARGNPDRERYAIHCGLGVLSGDTGATAKSETRAQAYALLGDAGQALADDATLGKAVMNAWLSSWALQFRQTSGGTLAVIRFDISVDAYTQR